MLARRRANDIFERIGHVNILAIPPGMCPRYSGLLPCLAVNGNMLLPPQRQTADFTDGHTARLEFLLHCYAAASRKPCSLRL